MSGEQPFDFEQLWSGAAREDRARRFAGRATGSSRPWSGGTPASEQLPSRVRIPQMQMLDGTLYRWQCEFGNYRLYRRDGHLWEEIRSGDRAAAIEWAKKLRSEGGVHPFKSVTQLVARAFPLVATISSGEADISEGGPGHCMIIPTTFTFEAIAEVDDGLTLRAWMKQRGFGWSFEGEQWARSFPRPVSPRDLRAAAEDNQDQICKELKSYGQDADHLIGTLWSSFPWLF